MKDNSTFTTPITSPTPAVYTVFSSPLNVYDTFASMLGVRSRSGMSSSASRPKHCLRRTTYAVLELESPRIVLQTP